MIRNTMIALALAVGAALPAAGQTAAPSIADVSLDPSRPAAAREVIELSRVRDNASQIVDTMMGQMFGQMTRNAGKDMSAADRAKLDRAMATMTAGLSAVMREAWPEYLDRVAEVYARTYSLSELHGIAAFYRTAAGQAMAAKTPTIARLVGEVAQKSLVPRIEARMPAIIEKMKADVGVASR